MTQPNFPYSDSSNLSRDVAAFLVQGVEQRVEVGHSVVAPAARR